eukprot:1704235-Pyramimonas_sp.AAC.1
MHAGSTALKRTFPVREEVCLFVCLIDCFVRCKPGAAPVGPLDVRQRSDGLPVRAERRAVRGAAGQVLLDVRIGNTQTINIVL